MQVRAFERHIPLIPKTHELAKIVSVEVLFTLLVIKNKRHNYLMTVIKVGLSAVAKLTIKTLVEVSL